MSAPSPFEVSRGIGNNLAKGYQKVTDENAIDNILSQALSTGSPEAYQDAMGKILSQVSPERQQNAFAFLQNKAKSILENQQRERDTQAANQAGVTPGLAPSVQAQELRNKQPPKPPGGLTGQPVPDEVSQLIPSILETNKEANADALAVAFDSAKIPRTYSNSYIENRRRQDEAKTTKENDTNKNNRKEQIEFHRDTQKYDDELIGKIKTAKSQIETISSIESALNSGNVKPSSFANIFKGFGKIGDKISEAIINKDEAALQASIPQLLEGWKEVFGVRLTDADLRLLQDKLPSIGKSPEANRSIVKILRKYADMNLLRGEIASEIKKENKGLRPLGYAEEIESRFDKMSAPVKIITPKGKQIEIPAYKLSEAVRAGAELVNE